MQYCQPRRTTKTANHRDCPARPIRVGRRRARCPHCGADDELLEVDVGYRWNYGDVQVRKGRIAGMRWSLGDGDFRHARYQCAACEGRITIPDSDTISQDRS